MPPAYVGPLVDHPTYPTPKKVLSRSTGNNVSNNSPIRDKKVVPHVDPLPRVVNTIEEKGGSFRVPGRPIGDVATSDGTGDQSKKEAAPSPDVKIEEEPYPKDNRIEEESDASTYRHESGELYAEDVDQYIAVLPDIVMHTAEVTIDDIQLDDPGVPLTDDHERLRQLIWRNKHLYFGKGRALPPAARGAICDIR